LHPAALCSILIRDASRRNDYFQTQAPQIHWLSHDATSNPGTSVGLPSAIARQVEQYAETVDASMSKAITALVRLGLQSQEDRKRQFFRRLKENLANDDPKQQDRIVDEFRALILGR
jgi:hypothetical protein